MYGEAFFWAKANKPIEIEKLINPEIIKIRTNFLK